MKTVKRAYAWLMYYSTIRSTRIPLIDIRRVAKGESEFPEPAPRAKMPWTYYAKQFFRGLRIAIDFLPIAFMIFFGILAIAIFGPFIGIAIIGLAFVKYPSGRM